MIKHIRLIPGLILGMAVSMPTLATPAIVSVSVVDPATVVAKGAGALVSVQVTCDPSFGSGSEVNVNTTLTERVGNKVAQGTGFTRDTITCDGTPQTFQVITTANFERFRPAPAAIAHAFTDVLSPGKFGLAQVTQQIHLVK